MEIEKLNVVVPDNHDGKPIEIVLRQGVASEQLPNKEPNPVDIDGTIDTPSRWLGKRAKMINHDTAHVFVSRDDMSITLVDKETDYYANHVKGSLELSKEMREFGINVEKSWEPAKLAQFLKMHRAFFKDKAENMSLVTILKNFKAKVAQDIERSKEDNGSKTDNFSQVVDSNLPKSFKLCIPLFKGLMPEEIEVEIYADVDGRNVSLSLVSAGANEVIEEKKNDIIDEQIQLISTIAPDIVIVEI